MAQAKLLRSCRLHATFLLVALALVSQLVFGSVVVTGDTASEAAISRVVANSPLCSGAPDPASGHHRQHHHTAPSNCLVEAWSDLASPLLPPDVLLPALTPRSISVAGLVPPPRGPPGALSWALYARGPPILT